MDGSVKSDPRLEVSVSFGRFEKDALSWEKWSSFSPNKYLDEAGSLSTPGSVAQKKAYFEAHYKKIAAKKAEQLELENSKDHTSPPNENNHSAEDLLENSFGSDVKFGICNGEDSVAEESFRTDLRDDIAVKEEQDENVESTLAVDDLGAYTNGSMDVTPLEEERDDDEEEDEDVESRISSLQESRKDSNIHLIDLELPPKEETILVEEHIPQAGQQELVEQPPESKDQSEELTGMNQGNSKLNPPKVARMVTPNKAGKNLTGTKKKVVSPVKKASQASTPKPSFNSNPTHMSVSQSAKKKVNKSPFPKSKNTIVVESKRAAPTSLHMSLSLGRPSKSSAAFSMTRNSLIMEKMGDKDIVKRAFKSFQNQTIRNPTDEKSSTSKQVSSTTSKTKVSPSLIPRKENKGSTKVVEKRSTEINQLKHFSSGRLHKSYELDGKSSATVSPFLGMKSDERAEKRKEFVRNLGAKSMAREAENARLSAKSKEEKESDIRKLRQSLNFKATPLPSYYRKSSEKDVAGAKATHHRSGSLNR